MSSDNFPGENPVEPPQSKNGRTEPPKPAPVEPRVPRSERRAVSRKLTSIVHKLKLEDANVLLVKRGSSLANMNNLHQLSNTIGSMGFTQQILLVVVDDFSDLSILNEAEMNKLGWQRISETQEPPLPD